MKVGSTATVSGTVYLSYPILPSRDCRMHMFSDSLSRNSCIHGNIKVQPACTCHVATVRKRFKRKSKIRD